VIIYHEEHFVLLGKKKRGFGEGKWLGIGGKVEADEMVEVAAQREVAEEIGVQVKNLQQRAVIRFYFPYMSDPKKWDQQADVYSCEAWEGDIIETEEMAPQWFAFDEVPFHEMWPDAQHWLPQILEGKSLNAEFIFDQDIKIIDQKILEKTYE
jgi:8-oxo-dGTP diphosphatase